MTGQIVGTTMTCSLSRSRRSSVALDHSKERRRSLLLLAHAFYGWRERAMYAARRRMRMERADRWYVEGHLKRNVFRVSECTLHGAVRFALHAGLQGRTSVNLYSPIYSMASA